jgi:peptidoglycan/xylan/chitin deacetylase (PgdA/CDA1 family)
MFNATHLILSFITLAYNLNLVSSNIYDKCIDDKHVALTFDDGMHENTINYVNMLNQYSVSGTFFINGLSVVRNNNYVNLVKQMSASGHVLGSHGFSHAAMEKLNQFNMDRELYDNELIFRQIFNKRPSIYRPPYFSYNGEILNIINKFGYDIITSNLDTDDWEVDTAEEIYNNYLAKFDNTVGKIILQHDYHANGHLALEMIIQHLQNNSYTIVPINVCIGTSNVFIEDNTYGPNLDNGINV